MPEGSAADRLDAELRRIAQALVADAPSVPDLPVDRDIDGVVTPQRAFRPGRPVAAGVAALVVVAVGVVAVVRGDDAGDPDETMLAADAGLEPAPQRLILNDSRRELPPDGDPVPLELGGLDPKGRPRPLPDGGHVVVGAHPVQDPPEGFNEFTDLTYGLAVVGADGELEVERDIERSGLLGVTATEAILGRQPRDERGNPAGRASIVAHNLATGEERVVRRDDALDADRVASAASTLVAGDLVTVEASARTEQTGGNMRVVVPGSEECTLRITDLATGEQAEESLDLECRTVWGVQASPDGSRLAVAYESHRFAGNTLIPEIRVVVVDLPDGAVEHDELLGNNMNCRAGGCPPGIRPVDYQGMAWDDASTLRVAVVDPAVPFSQPVGERLAVG
jgi:hypothetical protein